MDRDFQLHVMDHRDRTGGLEVAHLPRGPAVWAGAWTVLPHKVFPDGRRVPMSSRELELRTVFWD